MKVIKIKRKTKEKRKTEKANQFTDFHKTQAFTERYFRTRDNSSDDDEEDEEDDDNNNKKNGKSHLTIITLLFRLVSY